jgi:hypothetical protein
MMSFINTEHFSQFGQIGKELFFLKDEKYHISNSGKWL